MTKLTSVSSERWSLTKERHEYALGEFEDRYEINDASNFTVCIVDDEARAELIAAAPDLLRSAKLVVARWESGDLAEAVRELSAAIAAAEGRS